MNERIIELANEANKDIGYTFKMEEAKQLHELMERFARLIVHECMSCSIWVGKNNTNSVEPVHTAHAINQLIKKRFGVEE